MNIRKITKFDKSNLVTLMSEFDEQTQEIVPRSMQDAERQQDPFKAIEETANLYLTDSKFIIFVAEENSKLVGFICGFIKERNYKKINKMGFVEDWFVNKEYRSQRIGKQLFDSLIVDFKKQQCKLLSLETFAFNNKAIEIYHHMGFQDRLLTLIKEI